MANNKHERFGKSSRGVHTSDTNLLPILSNLSMSEPDAETDMLRTFNKNGLNADKSSILTNEEDYPVESSLSTMSTEDALYKMTSIKHHNYYPCKIELTKLRRHMRRKCDRQFQKRKPQRCCQDKCRCFSEIEDQTHRSSVPFSLSQTVQPTVPPEIKESYQSNQGFQYNPRSVRNKVRKMFSCFRPSSSSSHVDDAEKDFNEGDNSEYYHFDHGSPSYYRTTDYPPHLLSEVIAHRTTAHATKFWAEFFGSVNVGVAFFITFFIQFYRFILYSILRAIIVDFLQTTSDYFLKPMLAVVFNGFLQPPLTFTQNIFQSICNMAEPLTNLMVNLLKPFTECIRAFRVVEVKNIYKEQEKQALSGAFQKATMQNMV